jgi:hypothetical protein
MTFRDLKPGDTFYFEHAYRGAATSLANGPWRKTSARKYDHATQRGDSGHEVGTINVRVIPQPSTDTLTVDDLIRAAERLKAQSPIGGATPVFLETPGGWCEVRALGGAIDDDNRPAGLIETEPAAFD